MNSIALWLLIPFALLQLNFSKKVNYHYHSYKDILTIFKELALTCPQYIRIDTAQSRYGLDYVKGCGAVDSKCESLIVYLTDFNSYTLDRPQFYASGLVHGDEILGPTSITEFALYYCSQQPSQLALQLLKQKMLIFTPMTNAYGYFKRIREDIVVNSNNETVTVDPNRDFPYTQAGAAQDVSIDCLKTITARTINEIFKEHLIQSALTFHGGINVLGHPWGNFIHLDNNFKNSTESPDHSAFRGFGKIMQKASSSSKNRAEGIDDYILGDMSKAVYPVDGGLEDWAYAGSWENDIANGSSPVKTCKPSSNKPYESNKSLSFQLRCIMFLVEAAKEKQPLQQSLGYYDDSDNSVFNFTQSEFYGHIPRNMRLIYAAADLIAASFYMSISSIKEGDTIKHQLETVLMGCATVKRIELHQLPFDKLSPSLLSRPFNQNCTAVNTTFNASCYWKGINHPQLITKLSYDILSSALNTSLAFNPKAKGAIVYYKGINPDKEWGNQTNPDPNIPPQSHVVMSKTDPLYNATNGNYTLKANNQFYSYPFISFENGFFIIADDPDALLYPIQDDLSFIFFLTSSNKKKTASKATVKVQPKAQLTSRAHYSSQIEYDISLLISIGADADSFALEDLLLDDHITKQALKARIAVSSFNDKLTTTEHECFLFYSKKTKAEEPKMIIKCDKFLSAHQTNSSFIRSNLLNSLLGLNWMIKDASYQLRGIFSASKASKGKMLTSNMVCNSHISPNNAMNLFEIKMRKISNYKLSVTFSIKKTVLDNPQSTWYIVLIPYANNHLTFNLTVSTPQEVELDPIEANGLILGKTAYVLKIQSETELLVIQSVLKGKAYKDLLPVLNTPLNGVQMNKCSIASSAQFNDELAVSIVFSDKLPSKPLAERVNEYLLIGLIAINVIGLIIVLICCGIKLKKKLLAGYNKLSTTTEMEIIQIQDPKRKEPSPES